MRLGEGAVGSYVVYTGCAGNRLGPQEEPMAGGAMLGINFLVRPCEDAYTISTCDIRQLHLSPSTKRKDKYTCMFPRLVDMRHAALLRKNAASHQCSKQNSEALSTTIQPRDKIKELEHVFVCEVSSRSTQSASKARARSQSRHTTRRHRFHVIPHRDLRFLNEQDWNMVSKCRASAKES